MKYIIINSLFLAVGIMVGCDNATGFKTPADTKSDMNALTGDKSPSQSGKLDKDGGGVSQNSPDSGSTNDGLTPGQNSDASSITNKDGTTGTNKDGTNQDGTNGINKGGTNPDGTPIIADKDRLGDPAQTEVVGTDKNNFKGLTDGQKESMKQCLAHWGLLHPFALDRQMADRVLFAHLEVGPLNRLVDAVVGTEFSGISDTKVTDKPYLTMIFASVNVLATDFLLPTVTYRLLNPNGWYCIDFSFDVGSHLKVQLKKGAHLADPHWAFNIFADQQPIAEHNISILSKSEIEVVP